MSTTGQKVKAALSALETARRALNSCDEDCSAIDGIQTLLANLREELGETQRNLALAKEEAVREGAAHADWQRANAEAQAKGNEEMERVRAELRALNAKIKDARATHDNILAGISALTDRLKIGGR